MTPVRPAGAARRLAILVVACVVQFLVVLDVSLVTVAVPSIADDLALDGIATAWVVGAYTVSFAALLLLGGQLCDRWGARGTLLVGGALFTLATVIGACSADGGVLIAARAVQGAAAALMAPTSLRLLQDAPDERSRTRGVAAWTATSSVGGALGATLGGGLLLVWPWPAVLLFEGALALTATAAALIVLPRSARRRHAHAPDLPATLALAVLLAAALVLITEIGTRGVTSRVSLGAGTAAAVAGTALWLRLRRRPDRSPVPPALAAVASVRSANVLMLLAAAANFPLWYLLSLTLQQHYGLEPFVSGVLFLIPSGAVVLGSAVAPPLQRRWGRRVLAGAAFALSAASMSAAAVGVWLPVPGSGAGVMVPATTAALAMGVLFTTLTARATDKVPAGAEGAAAGLINATRQVGSALGLAVVTIISVQAAVPAVAFLGPAALAVVGLTVLLRSRVEPGAARTSTSTSEGEWTRDRR